jgi:hypothetical protein
MEQCVYERQPNTFLAPFSLQPGIQRMVFKLREVVHQVDRPLYDVNQTPARTSIYI